MRIVVLMDNEAEISGEKRKLADVLVEDFVQSLFTTDRDMLKKKARILLCSEKYPELLTYVSWGINESLMTSGLGWLQSSPYRGNGELKKALEERDQIYIIYLDYFVDRYNFRASPRDFFERGRF